MTQIQVRCKGVCGQEVGSAEVDSDGVCALCQIMLRVTEHYEEYKRLWAKRLRYLAKGLPNPATEKQLGRVVGRLAAECHKKLPAHGAAKLVSKICENARAEVEGFQKILTVGQALVAAPKPKAASPGSRKSAGGVYLPG